MSFQSQAQLIRLVGKLAELLGRVLISLLLIKVGRYSLSEWSKHVSKITLLGTMVSYLIVLDVQLLNLQLAVVMWFFSFFPNNYLSSNPLSSPRLTLPDC